MSANKANTSPDLVDPDEIHDLSAPEWDGVISAAKVQRGRPKMGTTKVSTTIRLSPEVIEHFKSGGAGWQSRIDEALRKIAGV